MKFNSNSLLSIASWVTLILGCIDLLRGAVHTFLIHEIALDASGIEPHPDALVLMSAFGISNFLTGFLLILVSIKARHLAPFVLLLIPGAYLLGSIGMQLSDVQMQSQFNGQYLMRVYLMVSFVIASTYFACRRFEK